ncbi:MAG: type III polyketide synthase [Ktedonobacterales bacterium]|nr:type III polyketide synthase [Ktedonobacterales bacterium]
MAHHPRIQALGVAFPPHYQSQEETLAHAQRYLHGAAPQTTPATRARAQRLSQLFAGAKVGHRHFAVDPALYYQEPRSTGARMALYQELAPTLGSVALTNALGTTLTPADLTDFTVVSCTGYAAPGLDVILARDLGMPRNVRRVCIGHMGCFGAMVGLRQTLAAVRSQPGARAALLSLELTSLHFMPTDDDEVLTSFALFGDAAAALVLSDDPAATGPEVVDAYCAADFAAADQMAWTITDQGFMMGLSPRVPVTLRRNIRDVVENLLTPHGLDIPAVTHWLVHPGGPSILDAVARGLELTPDQMARSWATLRDHGNCSSATVLLILDDLIKSGTPKPGEWGVMMAFGPGLTLETALLRF